MNPETPLFGRITVGSNRTSLGRAALSEMLIRAMTEIRKVRHRNDIVIQIELSPAKLPDATTFDKHAILERKVAEQTTTDLSGDSPFPGLTLQRVADCMDSPEYEAYAHICEPNNRINFNSYQIDQIRDSYESAYPDCAPHFPFWVD